MLGRYGRHSPRQLLFEVLHKIQVEARTAQFNIDAVLITGFVIKRNENLALTEAQKNARKDAVVDVV